MKFVSMNKIKDWQFMSLNKLGVHGANLRLASRLYIECVINREMQVMLHGLLTNILDMDTLEFEVGSGILEHDTREYKMVQARIEDNINDIKRAIILGTSEDADAVLDTVYDKYEDELAAIYKFGDDSDKILAKKIMYFMQQARPCNVDLTVGMQKYIEQMTAKIADKVEIESDNELYNNSWFAKELANKVRKENSVMSEADKNLLAKFKDACEKLSDAAGTSSVDDLEILCNSTVKTVYCIVNFGRHRVATQSEIDKKVGNMFVERPTIIPIDKYYGFLCMMLLLKGDKQISYKLIQTEKVDKETEDGVSPMCGKFIERKGLGLSIKKDEEVINTIKSNVVKLVSNIDNFLAGLEDTITTLKDGMREIVYPTEPTDKLICADSYSLVDIVDRILNEKTFNKYDAVAHRIAKQCRDRNNYELSEKQLNTVRRVYIRLSQDDLAGNKLDKTKCVEVAKELLEKHVEQIDDTVKSIAKYTIEHESCSQKQFDVLDKALREFKYKEKFQACGKMNATDIVNIKNSENTESTDNDTKVAQSSIPVPVISIPASDDDSFDLDAMAAQLFGGM